ncbi:hypothetical protein NA78x_000819 [Anatilimnocola sp. NA78]|uniref:hypothetical protein n=1 Tax=Anatilimnocola sp. NA78 TaxID=3415683 RepID=UPI003CE4748E
MLFDRSCKMVAAGALLLVSVLGAAAQAAESVTVPMVTKVAFDLTKGAVMEVTGEVPTGGYTEPMLVKVEYVKQPDDGIQDFNFVAKKPDGIVTQVVSSISARHDWKGEIPAWVKGVRIHGTAGGIKTVKLDR